MAEMSREEHIRQAERGRQDARQELNRYTDSEDALLNAQRALALAQLATAHEAAVSRLDAEQFHKDLGTVHPSGWQLPADSVTTGRELLERLAPLRERFGHAFVRHEGTTSVHQLDLEDVYAVEAMAQFVSRLMNEIESRNLVEADKT